MIESFYFLKRGIKFEEEKELIGNQHYYFLEMGIIKPSSSFLPTNPSKWAQGNRNHSPSPCHDLLVESRNKRGEEKNSLFSPFFYFPSASSFV